MQKIRSEDIPAEILTPDEWPMWRVTAVRNGKKCESTFIRSEGSQEHVAALGKRALRTVGVKGRYEVNVARYYPWLDPELSGHFVYSSKN